MKATASHTHPQFTVIQLQFDCSLIAMIFCFFFVFFVCSVRTYVLNICDLLESCECFSEVFRVPVGCHENWEEIRLLLLVYIVAVVVQLVELHKGFSAHPLTGQGIGQH